MSLNPFFTGQTANIDGPYPSATKVEVGGAAKGAGDGVFADGFLQALLTEIMDGKDDMKEQQQELLRQQEPLSQNNKTELPFEILVETGEQAASDDGQSLPVDNMGDMQGEQGLTVDISVENLNSSKSAKDNLDALAATLQDNVSLISETSLYAVQADVAVITDDTVYPLTVDMPRPEEWGDLTNLFATQGVETDIDFKPSFGELKDALAQLEKQLQGKDSPELILSNLTPDQMAQLKAYLNDPENAPEPDFALFIGTVKLTPPSGTNPQAAQQELLVLMQNNPGSSLAAQLNNLITSGGENKKLATVQDQLAKLRSGEAVGDQYKDMLNKPDARNAAAPNTPQAGADGQVKPDLSALQNWMFSVSGTLFSSMGESFESVLEQMGLTQTAQSAPNSPANLAGLMNANQAAGNTHPASQMVAATIQKAANKGDTTDIKLRLDPPDLGRLEIKLQFDGSGKLKTFIAVEKPETYLMLQRDAQILERSLQDAGVETDGAISFEMFQEGEQEFSHDGGHDGQGPFAKGQGDQSDNEEDVIYTSVNWMAIDPETGHTHYSIMA